MGITIDKENHMVVKTSYGYYTDNKNFDYDLNSCDVDVKPVALVDSKYSEKFQFKNL